MSNNMVYQQFPVTNASTGQLQPSSGVDSSISNMSLGSNNSVLQQPPVSDDQIAGFELSSVHGMQEGLVSNDQSGLIGTEPSSNGSHQFLLSNKQIGSWPSDVGLKQSSNQGKRKTLMEPLSINRTPHESLTANKRLAQTDHKSLLQQASTPTQRAAQMQSKSNTPKSQRMPAQHKRGFGKPGSQQLSFTKSQSQMQPSKVNSEANGSVRSKMRESLAAALSFVSHQSDKNTSIGQSSRNEGAATLGQLGDARHPSSDPVTASAVDSSSETHRGILSSGEDPLGQKINDGQNVNLMGTLGGDTNEFEVDKIMHGENGSFTENVFVKDELLQGNGLSWILDPYTEGAGKEINTTDNQHFNQGKEENQKNETSRSPESLAFRIEAELYKLHGGVNKKYKEKGRSLLFNLKDPNNPDLRERIMSGEIPPERLCSMTAEELASKELSQWRIAKAEELAQMVVLPSTEADGRRLVKKTHKGEFQVEFEQDDGASVELPLKRSSLSPDQSITKEAASPASKSEDSKDEINVVGEKSDLGNHGNMYKLTIPSNEGSDLMQGLMVDDEIKNTDGLPPIVSLDEFMQSLDSEPPFENLSPADGTASSKSHKDVSDMGADPKDAIAHRRETKASKKDQVDVSSDKLNEVGAVEAASHSGRNSSDIHAASNDESFLVPQGEYIWEGLVQLNIASASSIIGVFKCGEKTSVRDWPKHLEIKGRVRLDAFEKFLQELPMSRSRAVMVVHFVCNPGSTESERASLREVADSYIVDERVGFAEPAPGIELYLCPPHIKTLEMLGKILSKDHVDKLNMIDNGIIGVVVWRKLTFTGSPNSSSHSKHGLKRSHSSKRQKERDSETNAKLPYNTSAFRDQLHTLHKSMPNNDDQGDDDDIPPGFGPPATREDDLPEFDFSSASKPQQYTANVPSRGPGVASVHVQQTVTPADRMRELVQKYGQNKPGAPSGNWRDNRGVNLAIKSWKDDDDDDDIPEWQPHSPHPQSTLRPHLSSYQQTPMSMATSLPFSQPTQPPLYRGPQTVQPSLQQAPLGVRPFGHGLQPASGQFYRVTQEGKGQPGVNWRREAPRRGY